MPSEKPPPAFSESDRTASNSPCRQPPDGLPLVAQQGQAGLRNPWVIHGLDFVNRLTPNPDVGRVQPHQPGGSASKNWLHDRSQQNKNDDHARAGQNLRKNQHFVRTLHMSVDTPTARRSFTESSAFRPFALRLPFPRSLQSKTRHKKVTKDRLRQNQNRGLTPSQATP